MGVVAYLSIVTINPLMKHGLKTSSEVNSTADIGVIGWILRRRSSLSSIECLAILRLVIYSMFRFSWRLI